jgi:ABC-type branched-subunit amino acid transport system substrate-binding protein
MLPRVACRALVAGLAAACVALSACSGGSSNGPKPIRIGALIPVVGLGLPYYTSAFNAAVHGINARGGVNGRPILVENCDDRSDPNLAQACARQLVRDGVVATAANVSEFSMVEAPILDEAGIPQVGSEALNPEDTTLATAFPLDGGVIHQIAGGIVGMKRRNLHSLFIATFDTPPGRLLVQTTGQLVRPAGITLATPAYAPIAATDFTQYIQAAMQSKADVVFPAMTPAATIGFIIASKRAGAKYLILVPYGEFSARDLAAMGGAASLTENDVMFSSLPPLSATDRFPALQTFAADMDAEVAAGDLGAVAEERTGGSLHAWLCVQIIARIAASLATVDAPSMLHALQTSPVVDTLGLTPAWAAGRTGLPTMPRVTQLYGYLITQRNGVEALADPTPFNPFLVLGLGG